MYFFLYTYHFIVLKLKEDYKRDWYINTIQTQYFLMKEGIIRMFLLWHLTTKAEVTQNLERILCLKLEISSFISYMGCN